MTNTTLELSDDLAAAMVQRSRAAKMSIHELGAAVLSQWLLDQNEAAQEPWLAEDIAAINDGLAQSRLGQTISQTEARMRIQATGK